MYQESLSLCYLEQQFIGHLSNLKRLRRKRVGLNLKTRDLAMDSFDPIKEIFSLLRLV